MVENLGVNEKIKQELLNGGKLRSLAVSEGDFPYSATSLSV